MEPALTIITYISLKFLDQFLKEEGYGRLKKWFFPKKKYADQLVANIYKTIEEYEIIYPPNLEDKRFPFYHSQILFEELNSHILFKRQSLDQSLIERFERNPNIITPAKEELSSFYGLLIDKINNDKDLEELFIDENYKSKIFEVYESIKNVEEKIDLIKAKVIAIDVNTVFHPNEEWLKRQCIASINDLGNRYTPELNFELEVSTIFDGLGRTNNFKKIVSKQFDELIIKGKKVLTNKTETRQHVEKLESCIERLFNLYNSIDFCSNDPIPITIFDQLLLTASVYVDDFKTFYLEEETKLQEKKKEYRYYQKYGTEIRDIREFDSEILRFRNLLNSDILHLANNQFLILDGEAGIGKSHMIGDIVAKRINNNYESIFFLGQHFVTDEDPWTQIFKRLHINSNPDNFLNIVNKRAEFSKKRIIIFIDAINEGRGKYFWNENIKSFINEIKAFQWLGLVLTIRSSYKNLIFQKNDIATLKVVEHTIIGFRNSEYEASKLFFNNYHIELPNTPLLHPEFQNPLFLKLFCEGINKSGLTRIPDGLNGITSIINFFIKNVNEILSKPKRFDYSHSANLVAKAINALIQYKIENEVSYVSFEIAFEIVEDLVSKFIDKKGTFLDELISEGIFSKNLFWKSENEYEEGVYLAYERFEDHLICQYLLDKHRNIDKEFKENGKLLSYVQDQTTIYRNKGLIDAFSIQIPENTGREFYEYVPHLKDEYAIIESFVESLLWRKIQTITHKSKDFVNGHVFAYQGTYDLFWETIIAISSVPGHFFNAYSLHNHLMKFSMAERDAKWTIDLRYKYDNSSSVKRLIDWAWNENDKSHISDESIKLSSITLVWFHTSTNRRLRDSSTKALVSLLQNRISVLIEILKLFSGVNDPYVYERIYAVAYGCTVRTTQKEKLIELSEYVYNQIFNKQGEVFPHILLRDYARGVIEYTHYLKLSLSVDLSKIRPPYKSNWPDTIVSYNELKANFNNENYQQLWTSVMGFGDFARYIIGTNHNYSEWSGYKMNEDPIDRDLLFDTFKLLLSSEQLILLDNLDPIITEESNQGLNFGDKNIKIQVAIGRKSEKELIENSKIFKDSLGSELLNYFLKEIEPYLDHNHNIINTGKHFDLRIAQRLIFSKIIELGWNPELHLSFDKGIENGRRSSTNTEERIGKKYQWISFYEFIAKLSDNFRKCDEWGSGEKEKEYQGPWNPFFRDIDPTILIYKTGNYDEDDPTNYWWSDKTEFNWSSSNEDWVKNYDDLPKMTDLIEVESDYNQKWLVLQGFPEFAEPKNIGEEKWDYPHKRLWFHLRSYLIDEENFEKFQKWSLKQDFMGRWMPESVDRYEIFSREYYWSSAHEYFMTPYYECNEWRDIRDKDSGEFVCKVIVPTESYLWEEQSDKSKEKSISFLKPCTSIYKGMNLSYSIREGEFLNDKGEIVCFAPGVYHDSKSLLLIKKAPFEKYLQDSNLRIIWTILGEKEVIGGRSFGQNFFGRIEISGTYYFENDILTGTLNIKKN